MATAIAATYGADPQVALAHLSHDIAASVAWGGIDALAALQ
jgi:hypothetical protein